MSIREFLFADGTKLRLKGNTHEGKIGIDLQGFDFDKAVTQNTLRELVPSDCSALDLRYANIYKISLTSNISSFSVANSDVGTYIFIFEQDSVGGRTVTFDSNFYFVSSLGTPDFSSDSPNVINVVSVLCDGTNFYGTYMQDFVNS